MQDEEENADKTLWVGHENVVSVLSSSENYKKPGLRDSNPRCTKKRGLVHTDTSIMLFAGAGQLLTLAYMYPHWHPTLKLLCHILLQ